jgi:hypothetical protein
MAVAKNSAATQDLINQAVAQAQQGMVSVANKPGSVAALRNTWRKSAEHGAEQVKRFLRIFAFSAVTPLLDLILKGSHFDKATLVVLLVPVAETAFRQAFPALGAQSADSAPGMTIVPDQVAAAAPVDNAASVDNNTVAPAPVLDPTAGSVPIIPTSGDAAP